MTVTLTLSAEEVQALSQLIDVSLRHSGLGALQVASHFSGKLQRALADAKALEPE